MVWYGMVWYGMDATVWQQVSYNNVFVPSSCVVFVLSSRRLKQAQRARSQRRATVFKNKRNKRETKRDILKKFVIFF